MICTDISDVVAGTTTINAADLAADFTISELGEAVVSVVYAGVPFVLKLPPAPGLWNRVSYLADRILAHPSNEALVKAVIQNESLLPCPVARTQVTPDPVAPVRACLPRPAASSRLLPAPEVGAD